VEVLAPILYLENDGDLRVERVDPLRREVAARVEDEPVRPRGQRRT
jgi:hypothetical protein